MAFAAPRLVMISGPCAGVGKSSLMRVLAGALEERGQSVIQVSEDAVWGERRFDEGPVDHSTAWPEFRGLLHERAGSALSAGKVVDAFESLGRGIDPAAWWLQDWTWVDLLSIAVSGELELVMWSGRLRDAAADRHPIVLWLEVEAEVALGRAERERGRVWLVRHAREFGGDAGVESGVSALAVLRSESGARRRRVLVDSGWRVVDVDARADLASVLEAALGVLVVA